MHLFIRSGCRGWQPVCYSCYINIYDIYLQNLSVPGIFKRLTDIEDCEKYYKNITITEKRVKINDLTDI